MKINLNVSTKVIDTKFQSTNRLRTDEEATKLICEIINVFEKEELTSYMLSVKKLTFNYKMFKNPYLSIVKDVKTKNLFMALVDGSNKELLCVTSNITSLRNIHYYFFSEYGELLRFRELEKTKIIKNKPYQAINLSTAK